MVWERRQERLRSMVGVGNKAFGAPRDLLEPSQQMCFQVIAYHMPMESNDPKKLRDACEKYHVEFDEEKPIDEVFEIYYGSLFLGNGFIYYDPSGVYETFVPVAKEIFTTTNEVAIKHYIDSNDGEDDNELLNKVQKEYKSSLEKELSTKLIGHYVSLGKLGALKFQFIIQPYKPSLCPPEDLDVLKPITIIDGHVIHPATERLDLSSIKLQTPTRQP